MAIKFRRDAHRLGDHASAPQRSTPWYVQRRTQLFLGLSVFSLIAVLALIFVREASPPAQKGTTAPNRTLQSYFKAANISAVPVRFGDPGVPSITYDLPRGWSDAGPDTPGGAYRAAFYDPSLDEDNPTSLVVLLSRLVGDADPAKILEFAPGELENLPDYVAVSDPAGGAMSGFDAIQLAGLYTRDGRERIIAQKTVLIPAPSGLYVLQMNVDGPKDEAGVAQEATAALDESTKVVF